jgi:hypothetical protein
MKKLLISTTILTLLILCGMNKATTSHAQTPSGYDVTVSPVFFDLTANPGDSLSEKIRIRNNTSSPIPVILQVRGISGDLNGNLSLKQDKLNPATGWVKFITEEVSLKPLEWTDIPFTINVPNDAAYGYYIAINFTQNKQNSMTNTGATITGAAAVPVLLNVRKPGAKADAKIVAFSVKDSIFEYLPADFKVKIQNTGNIHVKPHGNIFISSGGDKNLAIVDVNPALGSILPQSARIFEASWSDGFILKEPILQNGQQKMDKNGKPETHLVFNWNKLTSFRFGKYTATLLMVFDNGARDVPLQTSISFWVIPYRALAVILIAIIIFAVIGKFILNSYINSQIKKRMSTR